MNNIILCLVLSVPIATPAFTQQPGDNVNGNDLHEICQGSDLARQGFCTGYIVGVVEGMRWGTAVPLMQAGLQGDNLEKNIDLFLNFCLPEDATWGQYQDVILQYIERHPESRHTSTRVLSQLALGEAFPCPAP